MLWWQVAHSQPQWPPSLKWFSLGQIVLRTHPEHPGLTWRPAQLIWLQWTLFSRLSRPTSQTASYPDPKLLDPVQQYFRKGVDGSNSARSSTNADDPEQARPNTSGTWQHQHWLQHGTSDNLRVEVRPPTSTQSSLQRISVCNQVSNGNSYSGDPARGESCSHCNFQDFHSLSK